jgi:hydrogenase small subunit
MYMKGTKVATKKYPVIWLQGASCTGCSVSILNAVSPRIQNLLLDELVPGHQLSLIFHATIMAGQGEPVIEVLKDSETNRKGGYILVVEGAIPTAEGGAYGSIGERGGKHVTIEQSVTELGQNALLVVALGTCAAYGGIPAAEPNPTLCKGVKTIFNETGRPLSTGNLSTKTVPDGRTLIRGNSPRS